MKFYRKPEALIKIIYKSGAVHEVWVSAFKVNRKGDDISSAEWDLKASKAPIFIGLENIEAIWQISCRHKWKFEW